MRMSGCIMLLGVLLLFGHVANAEDQYAVGDQVEAIELLDQHGKVRRVDDSTKVIVFVSDKFASEILKDAFADLEAGQPLVPKEAGKPQDAIDTPSQPSQPSAKSLLTQIAMNFHALPTGMATCSLTMLVLPQV